MDKRNNHGGLVSFEPTVALNKWGFTAKSWDSRIYPPFFHPDRISELVQKWEPDMRDIFICTHQKVGTHLTKKFVVELLRNYKFHPPEHGISLSDIGHGTVPWPEVFVSQYGSEAFNDQLNDNVDVPRLWYTHCSLDDLPFKATSKGPKFLHVFRDPRGVVVSQYHFYRSHPMLGVSSELDLESFIDLFLEGKLYFGDYFEHTVQWLKRGMAELGAENVLSLRYEDLVDSKIESVKRISNFLFPHLELSDESAAMIVEATEFNRMKKEITENPQTFHFNPEKFFREGKSFGWMESLTKDQQSRICSVAKEKWKGIRTNYEFEIV